MTLYGIRDGYTHRDKPDYFHDVRSDGKIWQPDVMVIAAFLARRFGCKSIVDIGCGRGQNLIPYFGEFEITGVDYGDNIQYCRDTYPQGTWITCDLENEVPDIPHALLTRSVVVCSDVIEHLINPTALAQNLTAIGICSPIVILTTPDRERTYGYDQNGPPGNSHHTREWTLIELGRWWTNWTNDIAWAGWTVSNNVDLQKNTLMMILNRRQQVQTLKEIEVLFDVEVWHHG